MVEIIKNSITYLEKKEKVVRIKKPYIYTKAKRSILVAVIPITILLDISITNNIPSRRERYLDY